MNANNQNEHSDFNLPNQDFKGDGGIYIKMNFYCLHIAQMSIKYANQENFQDNKL